MAERLFVYGTLHPSHAPHEIADLVRRFRSLGSGKVRGHRYDLGEYPAVVLDERAPMVKGEVFLVPDEQDALARLDAYEEFQPSRPTESLFLRQKTPVTFADGTQQACWIYVYNQPLPRDLTHPKLASVA